MIYILSSAVECLRWAIICMSHVRNRPRLTDSNSTLKTIMMTLEIINTSQPSVFCSYNIQDEEPYTLSESTEPRMRALYSEEQNNAPVFALETHHSPMTQLTVVAPSTPGTLPLP